MPIASFVAFALAAASQPTIHYRFQTKLIPGAIPAGEKRIGLRDAWFEGGVATPQRVTLPTAVAITEKGIVLPAGTHLWLAEGHRLLGCTVTRPLKFRLAYSNVCLVDTDGDGSLDHWFRRADNLVFAFRSRVSGDDVLPITPVMPGPRQDSPGDGEAIPFRVTYTASTLVMCAEINPFPCWRPKGLRFDPSETEQIVEYFGGSFAVRREGKQLIIRVVNPPQPMVLD